MSIIQVDFSRGNIIDPAVVRANARLSSGLIQPAKETYTEETLVDHSADPIKSLDDIERVTEFLKANRRYRDNMLFIVGINLGLRVSDLRMLRFADLINENLTFKTSFPVFEIKTRNTRKKKMNRYVTINQAVIEAVTLYLENTPNVSLSDFLFRSESNRGGNKNVPISTYSIERILKGVAFDCGLTMHVSTHTLRKTFCYHQMMMSDNSDRKLLLLQKMLNHASPAQTLDYIGITQEEIQDAYMKLNLGSASHNYLAESTIYEAEADIG